MAARWQVFFPSWVPSGLISSPSMVAAIADDCDIFAYWYGKNISFLTSFTLFCQFKSWYSILWASQVVQLNLKRISLQCRRLGSIPRLGRSPGEGNGDPLQYSFFFFFLLLECYNWQNGSIQMNFKMKSMHPRGSSNMRSAHNENPVRWKKAKVQSRVRREA